MRLLPALLLYVALASCAMLDMYRLFPCAQQDVRAREREAIFERGQAGAAVKSAKGEGALDSMLGEWEPEREWGRHRGRLLCVTWAVLIFLPASHLLLPLGTLVAGRFCRLS